MELEKARGNRFLGRFLDMRPKRQTQDFLCRLFCVRETPPIARETTLSRRIVVERLAVERLRIVDHCWYAVLRHFIA